MDILIDNTFWMIWNMLLAGIAVYFGYQMLNSKSRVFKAITWFLWLLFIPNTIYILTDIYHLIDQWTMLPLFGKFVALSQYITLEIVGIATFLIAFYQFEKLLKKISLMTRRYDPLILFVTNFVIAFGIVIGRVQRTNSWEVFTNPLRVLEDCIRTITSADLISVVLLFGVIGNILYFSAKQFVTVHQKKFKKIQTRIPAVYSFSWVKD